MARKVAPLRQVHKAYSNKMGSLVKGNQTFRNFVETIKKKGENSVFQRSRIENKTYDVKWVDELSVGFDAIDRIIAHPRTFIKETQDLVLAGQAKKINSTSIRHLASHTQYIHGINDQGTIIPERILSIGSDVDVQIYENRVLMSLIQRLTFFVEKRLQFISSRGETRNSDVLFMHSKTEIDGVRYEVDNRVKISIASDDNGEYEKNARLLERIKNLSDRLNFYLKSPFMKDMEGAKSVHSPLNMTNLLLKNPDYHKVAVLWKFIDSYTKLGISFDIEETKGVFNEDYFNEIYGLTAASLATLQTKLDDDRHIELLDGEGNVTEKKPDLSRKYEPKVMINLEDEVFLTHKFRYDQFPEHDGLREEPEREDEEMQDFAWTPEETKRFKETDKEYLSAQLVTAKEKREEAERDRSIMDRDALLAEMERRKKEEARLEREKALEEERLREEERRRLEELDEIARKEAEERLARENALLEEARAKIMAMATEDELIEDSIYESMNKHVEPHATEVEDENVLRSKEEPKEASAPSGLEDAFGALSFTAGRLQDELEKAKAELEEKNRRIAELEAKLSGVPAAPVMEETKAPETKEEAPVVHFAPKKPKAKTLNIRKSSEPKQAIKQTPVIIIAGSSKKKNKKGAFFRIKK